MIPMRPTGPTQAGRRIPKTRSREYLSGSRIMRAVDTAMLSRGSSAPPSVTQTGLPQWAFLVAIDIDPMTPSGPKGLSSPSAVSTPPTNSESPARYAQGRPGRIPSISMKPLVPSNPGPPKDPKSFWAPWPAIREPCTTRTIIGAASLTLEVFILTPSVSFSGLTTLVRQRRGRLPTLFTLDHRIYTTTSCAWPVTRPSSVLLFEMAARNRVRLRYGSAREFRRAHDFSDLQSFLGLYYKGTQVLLDERD